jgi:dihydrofolate reductase
MTATYTWDVFSTLDGYGSYGPDGDWGGYWGKQGPEFLEHRRSVFALPGRMIFGATTFREFVGYFGTGTDLSGIDAWAPLLRDRPATVLSRTLKAPVAWPNATIVGGDGVEVVAQLKDESDVALLSHGSLSLNWALMAAGLVDRVHVTIFPVISGRTGTEPIFGGAADFDLELLESRTFDTNTQLLVYRPTVH